MYRLPPLRRARRLRPLCVSSLVALCCVAHSAQPATAQQIVKKLDAANDRIELTVNTSRILTLDEKIPRVQVNNPEVLSVTPLSPNQVQISAKQPGVTQVNLWDENDKVYTLDVVIYGDARELELAYKTLFPHAAVKVYRYSNSLVLSGFVDRPDHVSRMVRLAEDYSPKVVNNISVGGVQQIVLNVKVMEVSRTKMRALGFDFANFSGGDAIVSSISGLIAATSQSAATATGSGGVTASFGIVDGSNSFFGFLEALRQYDLMKILAEPKIVAVSGRPASFNVGGEFPILVPQSLGTVSIEYKKFGTQVYFMPLVLGNGNLRLEVRPRVSEIDNSRNVVIQDSTIPGLRVREVDTAVEMKAGQTFALAGLIQSRTEAQNKGVPLLADLPGIGAAFRRVEEKTNEIELLILVRPEFVDAMDPHEVPPCGPGMHTESPSDHELYWKGYLEVPVCNGPCAPGNAGAFPGPSGNPGVYTEEVAPENDAPAAPPQAARGRRHVQSFAKNTSRRPRAVAQMRRNSPPVSVNSRQVVPQPTYPSSRPTTNNSSDLPSAPTPPGMIGPTGYDVLK